MTEDRHTYQRATSAALIGLAVQLVLSVAMALIGLWADSPALHAAAFHFLGGIPIWIALAMLYNQHRLESLESLESEQLAQQDAQTAAIFEEHADDLQLARRRLNNMYKWGLGGVSFFVAIYLIVLGAVWLFLNTRIGTPDAEGVANPRALLAMGLATTFVAFIVARYVAGMTRVKEWQILRGGASYMMGNGLVSLLVAVAAFLQWSTLPGVFVVLGAVVPTLMLLIGVEIVITFMLSAYRPRRPGEVARPAFDSRVLGLLTTPESIAKAVSDAINYQFGFEISRFWFYQLLAKAITPLVVFAVVVLILISSVVVVEPHQQAIITRFGDIHGEPRDPGLNWKLPWPIDRARKYPVARVHQLSVGSLRTTRDPTKAILWTTEHAVGGEEYLITGAPSLGNDDEPLQAASGLAGMALVAVDVIVQFRISNLKNFLLSAIAPSDLIAASRQRDRWMMLREQWERNGRSGYDPLRAKIPMNPAPLLRALASARVSAYCAEHDIDILLAKGRLNAGHELREMIQEDVGRHKLGLDIVFVGVAGIHPPQKSNVAVAFHEQIGALQERQSVVEKAHREAIQMLAEVAGNTEQAYALDEQLQKRQRLDKPIGQVGEDPAGQAAQLEEQRKAMDIQITQMLTRSSGKSAATLYDASAYRWRKVVTERSAADRFLAQLDGYRRAPEYFKMRLYLDALVKNLEGARKIFITREDGEMPEIRIDLKDLDADLGDLLGGSPG